MEKSTHNEQNDWVSFDQLRHSVSRQSKHQITTRKTQNFDPFKYFGGWEPADRTSIERLNMDSRLKEMMEYETSSASLNKSCSNTVISESLATPSVAEELEPTPTVAKTNNVFDFKMKYKNIETDKIANSNKKYQPSLSTKKSKDVITPQKQTYNSILLKIKKNTTKEKPKSNFKTMINKELDMLHFSIESPIQKVANKPCLPKVNIKSSNLMTKKCYLSKPYNRQAIVGFRATPNNCTWVKSNPPRTNSYLSNIKSNSESYKGSTFLDTNA